MTDHAAFEARVGAALQQQAARADEWFDASAIAASAAASHVRLRPWNSQRIFGTGAPMTPILLLVALAALMAAAVVAGGALRAPNPLAERILFVRDGGLYLADSNGANPLLLGDGGAGNYRDPQISVDGSHISVLDQDGRLLILDPDGTLTARLAPAPANGSQFGPYGWSPDGEIVAEVYGDAGQSIILMSAAGVPVWSAVVPWAYSDDGSISWSPKGTSFAMSGAESGKMPFSIWIFSRDGSEAQEIDAAGNVWLPRWNPDGRTLAASGTSGVWTVSVDNRNAQWISDLDGNWVPLGNWPTNLAWSPDGTMLAVANKDSLWTMRADGSELRLIWTGPSAMGGSRGLQWRSDGEHIVLLVTRADQSAIGLLEIDPSTGKSRQLSGPMDGFAIGR